MRKCYQLIQGKVAVSDAPDSPIQVFVNPDADERRYLIDDLKVDEHTLNSALDPDEISRLEFEPNHAALIFKMPRSYSGSDQLTFRVASTGAFLFSDRLVIVAMEEIPIFNGHDDQLTFRVASTGAFLFSDRLVIVAMEEIPIFNGKQFTRVSTMPGLLLRIMSRSTYHFLDHLKIINLLTDELEHKINASMENRYLINLFGLEKSLVYYLNAINSNGMVIEKLKQHGSKIGFVVEETELLDDILVENNQCYKQAEIYSNILASLMDARVSIVSNNLNILMKTLNIITIGIMVPTLVVSAFSMNVSIPIQHHPWAFWIIISLALLSTVVVTVIWRSQAIMSGMAGRVRQLARFPRLTARRGINLLRRRKPEDTQPVRACTPPERARIER